VSALIEKYQLNTVDRYQHIMIDYFFAPGNQYQATWEKFVSDVMPHLVETSILNQGGSVWLPCWEPLMMKVKETAALAKIYQIFWVQSEQHPLWGPSVVAEQLVNPVLQRHFGNSQEAPEHGFLRFIPKNQTPVNTITALELFRKLSRHHHGSDGFREVMGKFPFGKENNNKKGAYLQSPDLVRYPVGSVFVICSSGRACLYYDLADEEDGGDSSSSSTPTGSVPTASNPTGSEASASTPTGSEASASTPTGSVPTASNPTGSEASASTPTGSVPTASNPTGSEASAASTDPTGSEASEASAASTVPFASNPEGM
jgi:hypothetical protein